MKVIILAGGRGARLWPLSRDRYPKQFIKLNGDKSSLFQETFKRSMLLADIEDIYVVTNEKYKFLVTGSLEELSYDYSKANILLESEAKNTLPAIYAGVKEIINKGSDTVVVFPSDQMIMKDKEFIEIIKNSEVLTNDSIVIFGIKPDSPNTGYGYIAPGVKNLNGYQVKEFKEKPDYDNAVLYVNNGYYWNAGIFMFNTNFFINEVRLHALNVFNAFESSNNIKEAYSKIKDGISMDYGIMEKSKYITMVPIDVEWNDLGSLDTYFSMLQYENNNANTDNIAIDSRDNLIYSEVNKIVATIGIDDLLVVDSMDALLICKKGQTQKVKYVTEALKNRNDSRTEYHMYDYRPWGYYEILKEEKTYKIKKLIVNPGKKISYQLHKKRSEHWVVINGTAKVTIDNQQTFIYAGDSIHITSGQKHRLENPEKTNLEIIEIQTGEYLGEDDIIRFDDEYGRD